MERCQQAGWDWGVKLRFEFELAHSCEKYVLHIIKYVKQLEEM